MQSRRVVGDGDGGLVNDVGVGVLATSLGRLGLEEG
jgi:hypothetical protein